MGAQGLTRTGGVGGCSTVRTLTRMPTSTHPHADQLWEALQVGLGVAGEGQELLGDGGNHRLVHHAGHAAGVEAHWGHEGGHVEGDKVKTGTTRRWCPSAAGGRSPVGKGRKRVEQA